MIQICRILFNSIIIHFLYNLRYAYLPLIQGYILSAIQTTLPLGLKVGVMTEIFVSTQYGIGKQLYLARVQIDMTSIFAWVLWMELMAFLMIKLSDILIQFIQKKKSFSLKKTNDF